MTILKDVTAVIRDARGVFKELDIASKMRASSIARMSAEATLQFPVLMSRAINVNTAQSVTKALERQYAIMVQIAISLNPYLDIDKDTVTSYLRKNFHQNNVSYMESCMNVYSDEAYGIYLLTSINNGSNGNVVRSNKDQLFNIEECLNKYKVNDLYQPDQISMEMAKASLDYFMITEAKKEKVENKNHNERKEAPVEIDKASNAADKCVDIEQEKFNETKRQNKITNDYNDLKFIQSEIQNDVKNELDNKKFNMDIQKAEADYRSRIQVKLADNDVKKANELVPTTLSITLMTTKGDNFGGTQNFVIGVKGLMHPVDSNEMIGNLLDGYRSGNKFFNFIRWTTGEIAFIKDLLLNIDELKDDVIKKHSKSHSKWWTVFKRRKAAADIKRRLGRGRILPNSSIVCSMEEVVELNDVYGLDLMDSNNVKKLMQRYFLLGFAIVDEAQELCYFIFDGENDFQALSFNGLEKENNSTNDFKEIYKMINSGRL